MTFRLQHSTVGAVIVVAALVGASCSSADDGQTSNGDGSISTDPVAESNAGNETASSDAETPIETDATVTTDSPVDADDPVEADDPVDADTAAGYDFAAINPIVDEYVAAEGLNGAGLVIVDADDGVVYEDYWGEFDPERISLVASSSKMIAAGVLLRLQDDGLLDIDAPIADVVDWGAGNPDVTTAQLLSNSSGLVGLGPNPAYPPYVCQFLTTGDLQSCGSGVFETAADDDDVIPPDTEFRYGGAQWQVAGAVAEAVAGKSWEQLIDEIYVEPCGLETLGFNNHFTQFIGARYPRAFEGDPSMLDETDNPNIEGGAYVNTGDYAEVLLMHLRGGRCGENQVLSQAALDTMHADRVAAAYGGDAEDADTGYGMGWWVDRPTGRLTDPGLYGSVPWLDLEDGYGAYLVIEDSGAIGQALAELLYDEVDAAFAAAD